MLAKKPKGATEKRRSGSSIAGLLWMFVGAVLTLMIGLFLYLWNPFDMGQTQPVEERRTVQPRTQVDTDNGDYEFYDLLPEQQITAIPDEAIIEGGDSSIDFDNIQPDVVLQVPEVEERQAEDNQARNQNTQEFGISEETILNPLPEQQDTAAPNNAEDGNGIVIIEENATYDGEEPVASAPPKPQNSAKPNNNAKASVPKQTYILQINSFSSADEADRRRAQVLMAGVDAQVVKNEMENGQVLYQVISPRMNSRQAVMAAQQRLQNNGIDSLIVEQRR